MKRRCRLGIALGTLAWTSLAHADLGADVRVLLAERLGRGSAVRLKPRLLEQGEAVSLAIPPALLDPNDSNCTTVSVLGVVELHFVVRFSERDPDAPNNAFREVSAVGASEVTRCGRAKPLLASILVEMRSPRGVVETVVSSTGGSIPQLAEVLPRRAPGLVLPPGDPGVPPAPPPLRTRVERLAARARREAAASFGLESVRAGPEGDGIRPLSLTAGCHELTLLAESNAGAQPRIDLDIELVDSESGKVLGSDRAEDPDGALSLCLGSGARGELRFGGAAGNASLTLAHARWDLPRGLPRAWGPESLAELARLARTRHLMLEEQPIYGSLGVQGTSLLPVEVEPGACYTALLVPVRGAVRRLSLLARALTPSASPSAGSDADGVAVSFCARGARRGTLEVEGEGGNLTWLLALWETGRSAIGERTR